MSMLARQPNRYAKNSELHSRLTNHPNTDSLNDCQTCDRSNALFQYPSETAIGLQIQHQTSALNSAVFDSKNSQTVSV